MSRYYKDDKGVVFAISDNGIQDGEIREDWQLMTEQEAGAFVNPPKTPEQLYAEAKQEKLEQVARITVKTSSGKVFDGDEGSQNRMSRAVTASSAGEVTSWKLADNTAAQVTHEELKEALRLAGDAMTAIWIA